MASGQQSTVEPKHGIQLTRKQVLQTKAKDRKFLDLAMQCHLSVWDIHKKVRLFGLYLTTIAHIQTAKLSGHHLNHLKGFTTDQDRENRFEALAKSMGGKNIFDALVEAEVEAEDRLLADQDHQYLTYGKVPTWPYTGFVE